MDQNKNKLRDPWMTTGLSDAQMLEIENEDNFSTQDVFDKVKNWGILLNLES